ncbi:hypothetical protein WA158_001613 [Blastocystis sp. Blastoise]
MSEENKTVKNSTRVPVPMWRKLIGFSIIIASFVFMCYTEYTNTSKISGVIRLIHNAYTLPTDTEVIEDYNDENIILVSSRTKPHPNFGLTELEFDLRFANQMRVRRDVEYCQWDEIYEEIDGIEQVSYKKSWINHLVDSSTFKEQEGHYNPQRDPFPPRVRMPRKILAGTFLFENEYLQQIHDPWNHFAPDSLSLAHMPASTRGEGFYFADSYWYYSLNNMTLNRGGIFQKNLTRLDDNDERLANLKENCSPGDIRVGFDTQKVPFPLTIMGTQHDHYIVPLRHPITDKPLYIIADGDMNAEQLIQFYFSQELKYTYYIRIFGALVIMVGMIILKGIRHPFIYMPHILRSFFVGTLSSLLFYICICIYFFGTNDIYFYKSLLYALPPVLLAISVNVLYKYILMYKYAMKIMKEKEMEKKTQ